ncbi:hypothetical protein BS47DRAFT_1361090 [Hydnum rufescens UP504]|uniref:Uncharacterized protein n=1 Tax=Hydnum rufescens UP504 TaxID=1448309 RepID=A0A9P6DUH5_9AGAM|nr:hypothetical protein BS47DRAFT_1361090 [Hydnum rufescens UP504]
MTYIQYHLQINDQNRIKIIEAALHYGPHQLCEPPRSLTQLVHQILPTAPRNPSLTSWPYGTINSGRATGKPRYMGHTTQQEASPQSAEIGLTHTITMFCGTHQHRDQIAASPRKQTEQVASNVSDLEILAQVSRTFENHIRLLSGPDQLNRPVSHIKAMLFQICNLNSDKRTTSYNTFVHSHRQTSTTKGDTFLSEAAVAWSDLKAHFHGDDEGWKAKCKELMEEYDKEKADLVKTANQWNEGHVNLMEVMMEKMRSRLGLLGRMIYTWLPSWHNKCLTNWLDPKRYSNALHFKSKTKDEWCLLLCQFEVEGEKSKNPVLIPKNSLHSLDDPEETDLSKIVLATGVDGASVITGDMIPAIVDGGLAKRKSKAMLATTPSRLIIWL